MHVPTGLAAADSDASAAVRQLEARRAAGHRELVLADPTRPFDVASLRLSAWRPSLVPVFLLWLPFATALVWLGLVIGGYLPAPAWLAVLLGF